MLIPVSILLNGSYINTAINVTSDEFQSLDTSKYRKTMEFRLPLFYNLYISKDYRRFENICNSIIRLFNQQQATTSTIPTALDNALLGGVKEVISQEGYIDFYHVVSYIDAYSYIAEILGGNSNSLKSFYAFKTYDIINQVLSYVRLDGTYFEDTITYNKLRNLAISF